MDRAIRQHRLDALDQRAHRPVAQHLCTAGIGRDEAANRRGPFRTQAERKTSTDRLRRVMQRRENDARLAHRKIGIGIEPANLVHGAQRQDERAAVRRRSRAADHRAIPALRHDRHAMLIGDAHHRGDLLRRAGSQDSDGITMKLAAPILQPGHDQIAILDQPSGAGNGTESSERVRRDHGSLMPPAPPTCQPRGTATFVATAN